MKHIEEVARAAETAFAETERRADLDRWYAQLICCLKEGIERAAISPYSKSPPAVVRFENYHQLYCKFIFRDFLVSNCVLHLFI